MTNTLEELREQNRRLRDMAQSAALLLDALTKRTRTHEQARQWLEALRDLPAPPLTPTPPAGYRVAVCLVDPWGVPTILDGRELDDITDA